jgi:hypothetical protein
MTQQEQPSARVLRRLLAFCQAEGIDVRSALDPDPGPGVKPFVVRDKNEDPPDQALLMAMDLGLCLARGGWTWNTTNQQTIDSGDNRADTFACALLANLYTAEALALPVG